MRIAIVYTTKHGAVLKVAEYLKERINSDNICLFNAKDNSTIDCSSFDVIILGGSVYAGSVQKQLTSFINQNMDVLQDKHIGLFVSCMSQNQAQQVFDNTYPESLRSKSLCNALVGGELIMEKLNWFEKALTRVIGGQKESQSMLRYNEIDKIVEAINSILIC
ncbi:hypothetical protein P9112_008193 [Eukaryota sp. TZLM1-RC]